MRRLRVIWVIIVAAFFAACSPYPRESERMAEAMAQAEAVYSDGSLLVETDTVLFIPGLAEASGYYAGKKQYGKAALAALYNGYTERDFDKEAAMVSFKEAERYGELAHDSLTMARAEYWMGKMLYEEYSYSESLLLFRNATDLFGTHYTEKALAINAVACCMIMLRENDSALACLEQSLRYAEYGHSDLVDNKVLNNSAVVFKTLGDYDRAVECLRRVNPTNNEQKVLNCLNLAKTFQKANMNDSADFYYHKLKLCVLDSSVITETQCAVYDNLSIYFERNDDWETAVELRKQYERLLFEIMNIASQKSTYRIQQKYDFETMLNTKNQSIAKRQSIIVVLCAGLTLLAMVLFVSQRRLAVKTKQEALARERIMYYIQQYRESLVKQGETIRKVAIVKDHKEDKAIWDDLIKTVFGKKDPWDAIVEVFDTLHPEERKKMEQCYPQLSELEKRSFILSCLNVSRQDEALLLGINIHSIDKLRQSVRKKIANDGVSTSESS